jgi:hypothetical protein
VVEERAAAEAAEIARRTRPPEPESAPSSAERAPAEAPLETAAAEAPGAQHVEKAG